MGELSPHPPLKHGGERPRLQSNLKVTCTTIESIQRHANWCAEKLALVSTEHVPNQPIGKGYRSLRRSWYVISLLLFFILRI